MVAIAVDAATTCADGRVRHHHDQQWQRLYHASHGDIHGRRGNGRDGHRSSFFKHGCLGHDHRSRHGLYLASNHRLCRRWRDFGGGYGVSVCCRRDRHRPWNGLHRRSNSQFHRRRRFCGGGQRLLVFSGLGQRFGGLWRDRVFHCSVAECGRRQWHAGQFSLYWPQPVSPR